MSRSTLVRTNVSEEFKLSEIKEEVVLEPDDDFEFETNDRNNCRSCC